MLDMKFLHGCPAGPTFAVLYQDAKDSRHLKTYQIQLKEKELLDGPFHHANVEPSASMLIPVPSPTGA